MLHVEFDWFLINKEKLSKCLKFISGIKGNKQNIPVYNSIQVILLQRWKQKLVVKKR